MRAPTVPMMLTSSALRLLVSPRMARASIERRDESALSSEADYCFQGPRDEEQSLSLSFS